MRTKATMLLLVLLAGCGSESARWRGATRAIAPATTGVATLGSRSATAATLVAIELAPAHELLIGGDGSGGYGSQQLAVDGFFSDGSVRDLTRDARVRVADPSIARVTGDGRVEARADGQTWLDATFTTPAGHFAARRRLVVDRTRRSSAAPDRLELHPGSRALVLVDAKRGREQVQQLVVELVRTDGSREDLTHAPALQVEVLDATTRQPSSAARVSRDRLLRATEDGRVVDVRAFVPAWGLVAGARLVLGPSSAPIQGADLWRGEPLASSPSPLDQAALAALRQAGVEPMPLCTDEEFLRRATADALGRYPTEGELAAFEADLSPRKRENAIDRLLASPELASHWGRDVLADWVLGEYAPADLQQALEDDLANGLTLGEVVRRVVAGSGPERTRFDERFTNEGNRTRPARLFQSFGGMSVRCATCHDHKLNASWGERRAQEYFSFFAEVPDQALISRTGQGPIEPAWDLEPVQGTIPRLGSDLALTLQARRERFAELFTTSAVFDRGTAHRIWARVATPLLDPDHFLEGGLASVVQPRVLEALAKAFRDARTDLRAFLRTVLSSRLYQLSSAGASVRHDALLARRVLRRATSETIERGVHGVVAPPVPFVMEHAFRFTFGYQRGRAVHVGQPLLLANSPRATAGKLAVPGNAVEALADRVDRGAIGFEEAVRSLFRRALTRDPSADELSAALATLRAGRIPTREALEDLAAALTESAEFSLQ